MKKIFIFSLFSIFTISLVFASSYYYYTTNWYYQGNPVNNVRAMNFKCLDNGCYNLGEKTFDFTSQSNSITIPYSIPSPQYGYASYWFSSCYIYQEMAWKPNSIGSYLQNVNFTKKENCNSSIEELIFPGLINKSQNVNITAIIKSAFFNLPEAPYAVPSDKDLIKDFFSSEVNITLEIKNSTKNIVHTSSKVDYIYMDSLKDIEFYWIPDKEGIYNITIKTEVIDCKCSSNIINKKSKIIIVNFTDQFPINDTNPPQITIISPANITYNTNTINFNITADENLDTCIYTLDEWQTNITMTKLNDTYFYNITQLNDGSYTARFWCNDTASNVNNTEQVSFVVNTTIEENDTTEPIIFLISPSNNSQFYEGNINFTYKVTDLSNISYCKFYLNNISEYTDNSIIKEINLTITKNLTKGNYSWYIECVDSYNNVGVSETRTIHILEKQNNTEETEKNKTKKNEREKKEILKFVKEEEICGNYICEYWLGENEYNCEKDCLENIKLNYEKEKVTLSKKETKNNLISLIIFLILSIFILLIIIYLILKK
ncbi:MAG: hypothetical protein QW117_02725 [Candidatus Pacearchaeota archaeon]